MLGGITRADFVNAEVALFVGENPWQSHGFPHAHTTLKEMAADPARSTIAIDLGSCRARSYVERRSSIGRGDAEPSSRCTYYLRSRPV